MAAILPHRRGTPVGGCARPGRAHQRIAGCVAPRGGWLVLKSAGWISRSACGESLLDCEGSGQAVESGIYDSAASGPALGIPRDLATDDRCQARPRVLCSGDTGCSGGAGESHADRGDAVVRAKTKDTNGKRLATQQSVNGAVKPLCDTMRRSSRAGMRTALLTTP